MFDHQVELDSSYPNFRDSKENNRMYFFFIRKSIFRTFSMVSDEVKLDVDRREPVVCHWDDTNVPFSSIIAAVMSFLFLHILEY